MSLFPIWAHYFLDTLYSLEIPEILPSIVSPVPPMLEYLSRRALWLWKCTITHQLLSFGTEYFYIATVKY